MVDFLYRTENCIVTSAAVNIPSPGGLVALATRSLNWRSVAKIDKEHLFHVQIVHLLELSETNEDIKV